MQIGIGIAIGIAVGAALALLAVSVFGTTGVSKARKIRDQLLDDARRESDAVRREAQVEAREQAVRLRSEIDAELTDRRAQVLKIEERVLAKEVEIERKLDELTRRDQGVADREEHIRQLQDELKEAKHDQLAELERVAGLTQADARGLLLERGEEQARHELAAEGLPVTRRTVAQRACSILDQRCHTAGDPQSEPDPQPTPSDSSIRSTWEGIAQ